MVVNKHQQKSHATRRKLLEAALRIFARDGFEAARLEDIAKESGHTRGAFYANFDTKEDLFFALLEEQASARLNELRNRLEDVKTKTQGMSILREFYQERAIDWQNVLLTLEFKLFALRHPKLKARLAEVDQRLRASLNYEALTKLLPARNASRTECDKVLMHAVLAGLVLEHAYNPKRFTAEMMQETLGKAFDVLI